MPKGSIGLDAVQRSTMQVSLGDLIGLRVWNEGGVEGVVVPIRKLLLTVDTPSSTTRRAVQLDGVDLVKSVRKYFMDNLLQPKQYLLAVSAGSRLRLRVIGLETIDADLMLALCMGRHRRLGASSGLQVLRSSHLSLISSLVSGQNTTRGAFVLTRKTVVECQAQPNSPINLRQQVRTLFFDKSSASSGTGDATSKNHPTASALQSLAASGDIRATDPKVTDLHTVRATFVETDEGAVIVGGAAATNDCETQLQNGDVIESINGESAAGRGLTVVESLTEGPAGSFVTFGVLRGLRRTFITLERDTTAVSILQDNHATGTRSLGIEQPPYQGLPQLHISSPSFSDIGNISVHRNGQHFSPTGEHPPLPCSFHSSTASRGSYSPESVRGGGEDESWRWHEQRSPRALQRGANGRPNVSDKKQNKQLHAELLAAQSHNRELMSLLDSERKRVVLSRQLAIGLESQVQVVQQQLHLLYSELTRQGTQVSSPPCLGHITAGREHNCPDVSVCS
jgi:hypothetical protein